MNLPYVLPIRAFGLVEHYKVLDGKTVLFRPKEWRGSGTGMAAEING